MVSWPRLRALPAYQDYTIKSRTTSALAEVTPGKIGFELAVGEGVTPSIVAGVSGFIGITQDGGTYCTIGLTAANAGLICLIKKGNPLVNGETLTLARSTAGLWICTTDIVAPKHMPGNCTTAP